MKRETPLFHIRLFSHRRSSTFDDVCPTVNEASFSCDIFQIFHFLGVIWNRLIEFSQLERKLLHNVGIVDDIKGSFLASPELLQSNRTELNRAAFISSLIFFSAFAAVCRIKKMCICVRDASLPLFFSSLEMYDDVDDDAETKKERKISGKNTMRFFSLQSTFRPYIFGRIINQQSWHRSTSIYESRWQKQKFPRCNISAVSDSYTYNRILMVDALRCEKKYNEDHLFLHMLLFHIVCVLVALLRFAFRN